MRKKLFFGDGSMIVKFNGIRGNFARSQGGCPVCGGRRKSRSGLSTYKNMVLPTGRSITFHIGVPKEVSDVEGNYLLNWSYDYAGVKYYPFSEAK